MNFNVGDDYNLQYMFHYQNLENKVEYQIFEKLTKELLEMINT